VRNERGVKKKSVYTLPTYEPLFACTSQLSEEAEEQAALVARLAARAEAKARAREAEAKGGKVSKADRDADPISLEELLEKRDESKKKVESQKAKFLTKKEREKMALERMEAQRKAMQEKRENQRRQRLNAFSSSGRASTSSMSSSGTGARESSSSSSSRGSGRGERGDRGGRGVVGGRDGERRERDRELKAIKDHYLGVKSKKKKVIKPSEKFARIFQFDWELTEDTSHDYNPIYNNRMKPQLCFGRGYVAGMDMRVQRKSRVHACIQKYGRTDLLLPRPHDGNNVVVDTTIFDCLCLAMRLPACVCNPALLFPVPHIIRNTMQVRTTRIWKIC